MNNIEAKIRRKILPLLTARCEISSVTERMDKRYLDVPCRLDGSGKPVLNPDGTAKVNFTTHNVFIPKEYVKDDVVTQIDPLKVKRIWVTDGSPEDRSRDLFVKTIISNSDSGVFCFYAESSTPRTVL